MTDVNKLFDDWKKDPDFVREVHALEEEFSLAYTLIATRRRTNITPRTRVPHDPD